MSEKVFKTIGEQLALLESRGLKIKDKSAASDFLLKHNYYRVSGYSLTLRRNDVFYPNAQFQDIMDIYNFDAGMRSILLKYIEVIEVCAKSTFAYEFAKLYGPSEYLNVSLFSNQEEYFRIREKIDLAKESRHSSEAYLKHYLDDLKEELPIWVCVDLMTISDISKIYRMSKIEIKKAVASDFGLEKQGEKVLEKSLHMLTIIRNICAHGSRLFNRLFDTKPWLNKKDKSLLIRDECGEIDNSHLWGVILLMRSLLSAEDYENMAHGIIELSETFPFVKMKYYGFHEKWRDILMNYENY